MIRFTLRCAHDHAFESWFASGEAFEKLHRARQLSCPDCGDTKIEKSLMAPRVSAARTAPSGPSAEQARKAIAALRDKIESSAHYVGSDFVREARAIHDGKSPERAIYGEARPEQARALIDDGIGVAPLPFIPRRKTN
ncbi:DUF1178 family protein [Oceaniglobus indicus]|uniref:DUF1178 family protein n=1 Tax=Oceaniglobus indicus TaxID=2047749 RepID=UPI000C1941E2|nr:DUF1178 family protein [Oceaniglobus indicus]